MPRARLTYEERLWMEDALEKGLDPLLICEHFEISPDQLLREKKLGWIKEEKTYSAKKAQLSLYNIQLNRNGKKGIKNEKNNETNNRIFSDSSIAIGNVSGYGEKG